MSNWCEPNVGEPVVRLWLPVQRPLRILLLRPRQGEETPVKLEACGLRNVVCAARFGRSTGNEAVSYAEFSLS